MMSTPSSISRLLYQSLSVHLEDNHQATTATPPSPSATATFRTIQRSQAGGTRGSPPADITPSYPAAIAAEVSSTASATSPRGAALTSAVASTTKAISTAPTLPISASAHAAAAISASATLPSLPPLAGNFVGTWAALLPGGGLSRETDISTTNSSTQHEAAAHALLSTPRPAASIESALASPLRSDVNTASKWQAWSTNPLNLPPIGCRKQQEEGDKSKEKHYLPQRIATDRQAPLERLTTAASTPAFTTRMPAVGLAIPSAPSTAPASQGQTEDGSNRSTTATSKKTLLAKAPASLPVTSLPVARPVVSPPETTAAVGASRGGTLTTVSTAGVALTVRAAPTSVQRESQAKTIEDDTMLPSASQLSPPIRPPNNTCCFVEAPHDQGLREGSGACGAQGHSLQKSDSPACLRSGSSSINRAFQEPIIHTGVTSTTGIKQADHLEAASSGSQEEVGAFSTGDATASAATTDALKATYLEALFTQLQPAASPANSNSTSSPHSLRPYPCFTAPSPSPYYAAGDGEASCGLVSQRSLSPKRSPSNGNSSTSSTKPKGDRANRSSLPAINAGSNSISTSNIRRGTTSNVTVVESNTGCTTRKTNGVNTSNDSSECSDTSFLPSLLPLLSHIKTLSISSGESPLDLPSFATTTDGTPPQTSSASSRAGESCISAGTFDSSGCTKMQTQLLNGRNSPKPASPYFPFFSFNSISSAFQSPAVSYLSRKSFCTPKTIPPSPAVTDLSSTEQQSVAAASTLGIAVAALSLDPQPESAVQQARLASGNLSDAVTQEGRKEGPRMARQVLAAHGNREEKVAASGFTGIIPTGGGTKAPATEATRIATAQTADMRPVLAGRKTEVTSRRRPQKQPAAAGPSAPATVDGGAGAAASSSSPLSFSSAATPAEGCPQQTGLYARDQQQVVADQTSGNNFSSSSGVFSSNNSSRIINGPNDSSNSNTNVDFFVMRHAGRSTEPHGFAPAHLSTMQHVDWCSSFVSDTAHEGAEGARTIATADYTFAVDEVYCMQTPSRTRFSSVRISPLLSHVYAASDNGVLCVWNMTGCCQRPLIISSYHSKAITELDVSPDGQLLASASLDGTIRVKHTASATHVAHPLCNPTIESLNSRSSSAASSYALPASYTYSPTRTVVPARLTAAYNVNASAAYAFHNSYNTPAAPPSATTLLAAQTCTGLHGKKYAATVIHPSVPPSPPFSSAQPSSSDVSYARGVPSSNRLSLPVSTARLSCVPSPPPPPVRRPVSAEQQLQQHTVRGHSNAVVSLHFSSDGALLLSASRDKTVKLWKNPSLDFLAAFTGHTNWVCCARFAPIAAAAPVTFASCAEDRTVRVWNAERKVPVLFFRLCESFQSTTSSTLCGSLANSVGNSESSHRAWGSLAASGVASSSSKFGPCLKSCRFIFGGASVLAGGSSDGTVTLWDVREEPKAPSQYYNASWLQSAPLYSTASRPGSAGCASSSFTSGFRPTSSSLTCDTDRRGGVKKAGISYLDTTADGTSLLALSTSGVAHLIDLRYNKPLFSVSHTKTAVVSNATPLVARGKKTKSTQSHKQDSLRCSTPPQATSHGRVSSQPVARGSFTAEAAAAATPHSAGGHTVSTIPAETAALAQAAVDIESASLSKQQQQQPQQQQQRQKRTTAVITAASFGPVLKQYESLSQLQQQQVLATADAEGKVVIWRWDMAFPQVLYQVESRAVAAAPADDCLGEQAIDPFSAVCSPYSADVYDSYFPHKATKDNMQPHAFVEQETHATEADFVGGAFSCRHTAESYSLLDLAGERV